MEATIEACAEVGLTLGVTGIVFGWPSEDKLLQWLRWCIGTAVCSMSFSLAVVAMFDRTIEQEFHGRRGMLALSLCLVVAAGLLTLAWLAVRATRGCRPWADLGSGR
ncbi:hypothetical protein AACH06_28110 [Ideonella sp. DXS29W]|uniref:Uncharacterized protein n=1 Tax=Ideonella lacteola TaxID=2984193 RepID=A0ABU9C1H9_9BURK